MNKFKHVAGQLLVVLFLVSLFACEEVEKNSKAEILIFEVSGHNQTVDTTIIDNVNRKVTVVLKYKEKPEGNIVSSLSTTISTTPYAKIVPPSGITVDFTNPYKYTLFAEDATAYVYEVIVKIDKNKFSHAKNFAIANNAVTVTGSDINLTIPKADLENANVDLKNVAPSMFTFADNATINPAITEKQDFTTPVKYTITSEDGKSTTTYTVVVTVE